MNPENQLQKILETKRLALEQETVAARKLLWKIRSRAPGLKTAFLPSPETAWLNSSPANEVARHLSAAGFVPAGVYSAGGAILAGFAHEQARTHASLVLAGSAVFTALISRFADGTALETCDIPQPVGQPVPVWLTQVHLPGAAFSLLAETHFKRSANREPLPAIAADFSTQMENDYFRSQSWTAEQGGASREHLAARYRAMGKLPPGAEGEAFLDSLRCNELERWLCNWWRLQGGVPPLKDELLETVVIIHDEMPLELLANRYWCATNDYSVKERDFAGRSGREAFAKIVSSHGNRLRLVLQKQTPTEADFYLPA